MKAIRALKRAPLLAFAALTACAGGSPMVPFAGNGHQASALVPSAKPCHMSYKLSSGGGFLKLPACFGFSGRMAYPKSTSVGSITATIMASTSSLHPYQNPKGTIYYMKWVFKSTSSSDTIIHFYGTVINPHDGSFITGPSVNPKLTYNGLFEVPNQYHPIKKTKIGITITGRTRRHSVKDIPFPGTPVLAGVANFVLISTAH